MALTKGCNKDANDSEVSWTTQGGLSRCRGLCRPSFSKVPCQQTGSPWSCSGKGLYCSVPAQDSKALRSLLMVGLQTTAAGSCLQHGELFYYLSNEWNFHSFQRDPKSVSMQAAFPVGNKTRYSVLDGFSASCSEGKALRKSRRGEETRKGEMQRRKVGCKERQRDRPWVCWAALPGPQPFLFSLAFWRDMSGPHAPWPFIIRKIKGSNKPDYEKWKRRPSKRKLLFT